MSDTRRSLKLVCEDGARCADAEEFSLTEVKALFPGAVEKLNALLADPKFDELAQVPGTLQSDLDAAMDAPDLKDMQLTGADAEVRRLLGGFASFVVCSETNTLRIEVCTEYQVAEWDGHSWKHIETEI